MTILTNNHPLASTKLGQFRSHYRYYGDEKWIPLQNNKSVDFLWNHTFKSLPKAWKEKCHFAVDDVQKDIAVR
jgi:hypothetical protein